MRVLFAGGGTGGHLYPGIALADALRPTAQMLFVGTADRLETHIVPQAGYELHTIAALPLTRGATVKTLRTAAIDLVGIVQSIRILQRFQPDMIVATGGYVCFPVMAAAKLLRSLGRLRARLALLEPNAQPGLTNRLLAPIVDEVWGALESGAPVFGSKYVRTGIPVRASLLRSTERVRAAQRLDLDPARRIILVVGGSQGARSINQAVAALVTRRALPADWQILHIAGQRDFEAVKTEERAPLRAGTVVLAPYVADMESAYAVAEIVVARAGASTIGELAALGKPSILIPYPFATEDHQRRNAEALERAGAAIVLDDGALNADTLWWSLQSAMEPQRLEQLRQGARSLAPGDPVAAILARIDALTSRKRPQA